MRAVEPTKEPSPLRRNAAHPARRKSARSRRGLPAAVVGAGGAAGVALAVSAFAGSVVPLLVTLIVLLAWLVTVQRRHRFRPAVREQVELTSLWRLMLGVFVTTVIGTGLAAVLAVAVNSLGVGGDGRLLLEALLAVFVLAPAFLLGSRCRHWWSFAGSLPLYLLLVVAPSLASLTLATALACALALGSLAGARASRRRSVTPSQAGH